MNTKGGTAPMEPTFLDLWHQAMARLKTLVSPAMYRRWLAPIRPSHMEGDCLYAHVPGQVYRYWLEDNYGELLRETLSALALRPITLSFLHEEAAAAPEAPAEELKGEERFDKLTATPSTPTASAPVRSGEAGSLNPSFQFESFVVGPSNHYAHAASWAVAHAPGRAYNPLFIYGATGLGKTHLMHAIGHHLVAQNRSARVAYISTERFVNEFIDAIQNKKYVPFRRKYRHCDILLVDDIHFLGRGDQIQEEFFHNFNTLFEAQKQIVLSSDRPATEITNLEQRLVSRFEWGLTVQLQPPDQETRVAILRRKQQGSVLPIADEALVFTAQHIKSNIRRLEGAWARLWFATRLKGRMLTLSEVEEELQDVLVEESKTAMTAETIQKRVAAYYDIRLADMTSKRRDAHIAFPRQVAMFLCRSMTQSSLQQIGESFGGRDHGTVLHAFKLVERRAGSDPALKQALNQLTKQLTNG